MTKKQKQNIDKKLNEAFQRGRGYADERIESLVREIKDLKEIRAKLSESIAAQQNQARTELMKSLAMIAESAARLSMSYNNQL